jgi:thymidylate synthase
MYISAHSLDDLMMRTFEMLLASKNRINPSRGDAVEKTGVLLKIANPRARLSRSEGRGLLFGCIGELLWYLSGSRSVKFISYYLPNYEEESSDGKTIYGGYGPRLLKMHNKHNQIKNVIALLKAKPDSRRAVIQLFDAADIVGNKIEIPCTSTLQFLIRQKRLHLIANMRSNDAYKGLPHDVFAFTMLQELIACSLGMKLGIYKHSVGSLHLYDKDRDRAQAFVDEGWQTTNYMPTMPPGDPWSSVKKLLTTERSIRIGKGAPKREEPLADYWEDIERLLLIFQYSRDKDERKIRRTQAVMSTDFYNPYINKKKEKAARQAAAANIPTQLEFPAPFNPK